jgi:hypothetical protein
MAASRTGAGKDKGKTVAVISREDIEPIFDEVRSKHPAITDFQAEIVRTIVHLGIDAAKIARLLKCDVQRVRYHMEKSHVQAFKQELAMQAVGWDAVLAQQTLRGLLHARSDYIRLEAAKDMLSRAGLSMERSSTPAVAVQLNFGIQNNGLPALAQEPESVGVVQEGGAQPPPAAKQGQ